MSGDQPASSFGDHPNAQPPTPKQTPTSTIFPSPVFETPKHTEGRFDDSSGWTPRFAEEYSVFNATPGNLRGSQGPFPDFAQSIPYTHGSAQKRPLSAGGIAAEIASHANHFSPNPLPVDPSKQLKSSTLISPSPIPDRPSGDEKDPAAPERLAKKARRDTHAQTATPPPSAHKGSRKLAPKLDTNTMQNDQGYGQPDFMGHQPQMGNFVTAQSDMFGYPLSAPATAQAFGNQRSFWDPDPGMGGMEIDFGASGNTVFQGASSAHPSMGAMDWARANQLLQEGGPVGENGDENTANGKGGRPMVAEPMHMLGTSAADTSVFATSFPTAMGDPFGIVNNGVGVDPGLLYSRPPSSSMDMSSFNASLQPQPAPLSQPQPAPLSQPPQNTQTGRRLAKAPPRGELRRTASEKDMVPRKQDRVTASSPIKQTGRPGLARSASESKGKNPMSRASLPTLAPAPRPQSQMSNSSSRPVLSQPSRPSGRSSPVKGHHHQRLPSLSSIPETTRPRTRTQAKFTIDANGRARVETTIIVDDDPPPTVRKRHSAQPVAQNRHWQSSESDDDSSSTDDDPIVIPSRNTSFALPDPRRPTSIHPFHSSQRSVSERSTASYSTFRGSQDDGDSDRETVINDLTPQAKASGDAVSELQKLRESRRVQLPSSAKSRRFVSFGDGPGTVGFVDNYPAHMATSPTTMTDTSLPTPSTDSRTRGVRCTCNRTDIHRGDGYMVQCESCEMFLHGNCIGLTEQTMPSIYICAFCAHTNNMRGGGRIRDSGPMAGPGGRGTRGSPLAHKSFRSFR